MNLNSDKNQNLDWLKEPVSEDFKSRVFKAVNSELEKNKPDGLSFNYKWLLSAVAGLALVTIMTIRLTGQLELNSPTNTFDDLALLTPAEIELVENLDLLDNINDIDLDQIRQEMKEQKGPKS